MPRLPKPRPREWNGNWQVPSGGPNPASLGSICSNGGMMRTAEESTSGLSTYSIRAVERVCDIMDLIQQQPDTFTLADIVATTGLPKSSAFRYLSTLESRGYVSRDPVTGKARIGPNFLPLHDRQLDVLVDRSRPLLERLRDKFEESINLGVLEGNRIAYLEIVESPRSVRLAARKGDLDPLHCTALGKAVATLLPTIRVQAILEAEGMPSRTPATITDVDRYLEEVDLTRDRGFALDDGENEPDGRCLAVPLIGSDFPVAISLSAPASRFRLQDIDRVAQALTKAAVRLTAGAGRARETSRQTERRPVP